MSGSAEHFRQANLRAALAMSPEERVRRALELGQSDLQLFAAANGLSLDDARSAHRRLRAKGRRGVSGDPGR